MNPVIITGRNIANTWWGRKWCSNIESFADWSNRLPRGRSYCRGGYIEDLDAEHFGSVRAFVSGSHAFPYRVTVQIAPLGVDEYLSLLDRCRNRFENVAELLEGCFPAGLEDMFESVLFPKRSEIRYSCSCPDWASLCKHVAAVLYGIGSRLDTDPGLIFSLRGIDLELFLDRIVDSEADSLWLKAGGVHDTSRIIPDDELPSLFGVDEMPIPEAAAESSVTHRGRGSALRLDRQTFIYSDRNYTASVFKKDGRFILTSGARVSSVTKRGCPDRVAAMREKACVGGSRLYTLKEMLRFDNIEDVTAFINGTDAPISPWRTVFGVSYEDTVRMQAYLYERD